MHDWVVVGAGFSGSVIARCIASQLDQRVLVVDRRAHIGGNAHDHLDENGVLVHKYGPHIFHTNSARVWDYLSQFTQWRPYEHRVHCVVEGKAVSIPFNLNSLHALFPTETASRLETALIERYGVGTEVPILRMRRECDGELRELADFVYEKIFLGYTIKQWDLRPDELSPSVTARVPMRVSRDDRYFTDKYQAIPAEGYTRLFERLLSHPNIEVLLGVDWRKLPRSLANKRFVYSGAIDEFFNYVYGELPYRSLRFEFEHHAVERLQPVAQMNFPGAQPYTRQTEYKHLTGQRIAGTTVSREFAQAHAPGANEPFYPIPREENRRMFEQYRALARQLDPPVVFCGRLADYQYYNMDQVVARALTLFEQEILNATSLRGDRDAQPQGAAA